MPIAVLMDGSRRAPTPFASSGRLHSVPHGRIIDASQPRPATRSRSLRTATRENPSLGEQGV